MCTPTGRAGGPARALLAELVDLATAHGFHSIIGRIADHNEASIALHRSLGFEEVGTEREVGRKFHRWIDVARHAAAPVAGPLPGGARPLIDGKVDENVVGRGGFEPP